MRSVWLIEWYDPSGDEGDYRHWVYASKETAEDECTRLNQEAEKAPLYPWRYKHWYRYRIEELEVIE